VDIEDSDTVSDLQEKIIMESPRPLPSAPNLSLYRAPEGVGSFTEPGVTVGPSDEISTTSSLQGMCAETNKVQVIVRPPSRSLLRPCYHAYLCFILEIDVLLTVVNKIRHLSRLHTQSSKCRPIQSSLWRSRLEG
jgi:hypothetical protein